ncbi:hypothetical protein VCUG_02452 [Vavraia culicis subsp. floridensis]|uniref:Uncharacterized protein n=1 Tax=Vavraia culicis (isolate floridensis) TaxID=948595 RepID=L2GQY7_VAVCU|nr:uncharacterized protein VCUG_02452 [Vavraia culicis subsp. floridensis]ELA46061.1 hypothetical protein VCUG_02452 [Vavraia culicis subsp. floridensis]
MLPLLHCVLRLPLVLLSQPLFSFSALFVILFSLRAVFLPISGKVEQTWYCCFTTVKSRKIQNWWFALFKNYVLTNTPRAGMERLFATRAKYYFSVPGLVEYCPPRDLSLAAIWYGNPRGTLSALFRAI